MNKYKEYQEALDNMCCGCYGGDDGCNGKDKYCSRYLRLQELVNQQKQPTLEEVKKEWEELGYKWDEKLYTDSIALSKRVEKPWLKNETYTETHFIIINIINKTYRAEIFRWLGCEGKPLTFQEHQLLTKTFKALGWYDE